MLFAYNSFSISIFFKIGLFDVSYFFIKCRIFMRYRILMPHQFRSVLQAERATLNMLLPY